MWLISWTFYQVISLRLLFVLYDKEYIIENNYFEDFCGLITYGCIITFISFKIILLYKMIDIKFKTTNFAYLIKVLFIP